ncbi:jg4600 [Pararge aegeria aegeria]|uniref:Jg4600 protein n=1 Tax=Pararge aegeria aegeria TaxID=348720 RepID=A0A8S4QD62_9NEOP|nr:jg4600 [Pararge aegeria aegeria]
MNCSACNSSISVTQKRVKCSNSDCLLLYHSECVNYDEISTHRSKWICPTCVASRPKEDNSNTPISNKGKGIQRAEVVLSPTSVDLSLDSIMSEIRSFRTEMNKKLEHQQTTLSNFNVALKKLQEEVTGVIINFTGIQEELNEAIKSLKFLSDCHDDQNTLNKELTARISKLESENSELRSKSSEIEFKISQLEQQSRDSNLEIQCVPEHRSENLLTLVNQLAKVVNFELGSSDILNFHRVAKMNAESKRPRSIIVKLSSPLKRDNFLAAVRTFNKKHAADKFNTSHLGIAGNKQQVYVTEHLSPNNKRLHATTRIAAQEKKYRYVWVRGGRIFVRKNDESPPIQIKSVDALQLL